MERRYLGCMCRFSISVERYSLTCQERGGEGERGRGRGRLFILFCFIVLASRNREEGASERVINRESRSARLVG